MRPSISEYRIICREVFDNFTLAVVSNNTSNIRYYTPRGAYVRFKINRKALILINHTTGENTALVYKSQPLANFRKNLEDFTKAISGGRLKIML